MAKPSPRISVPSERLARLLLEAKDEHTRFEVQHGPDANWHVWYGLFLHYRLNKVERAKAVQFATEDFHDIPSRP